MQHKTSHRHHQSRQTATSRHFTADKIERRGTAWVVLSKTGKVLGRHMTEEAAKKHLAAIEIAKAKRE